MKHEFKVWIYAKTAGSKVVYELSDIEWYDPTTMHDPRVFIGAHTVTLDLPDISEFVPDVVAQLEARKTAMQATAAAAIAEVDGQIQSLLAIGQEVSA